MIAPRQERNKVQATMRDRAMDATVRTFWSLLSVVRIVRWISGMPTKEMVKLSAKGAASA